MADQTADMMVDQMAAEKAHQWVVLTAANLGGLTAGSMAVQMAVQ